MRAIIYTRVSDDDSGRSRSTQDQAFPDDGEPTRDEPADRRDSLLAVEHFVHLRRWQEGRGRNRVNAEGLPAWADLLQHQSIPLQAGLHPGEGRCLMETTLKEYPVSEIVEGFHYNELEAKGLYGLNGQLTIQPEFQRNDVGTAAGLPPEDYRFGKGLVPVWRIETLQPWLDARGG